MKRKLTLVVEIDQPEANWIWEAHKGQAINGVRVAALAEGDMLKQLEEVLEDLD